MGTVQLKEHLIAYINRADDRILRAMHAMLENYMAEEEQIVGFTATGEPLTKKQLAETLEDAVKSVEKGKGLSSKDIRNIKKDW